MYFIQNLPTLCREYDIIVTEVTSLFTQTSPPNASLNWTEWIEEDQIERTRSKLTKMDKIDLSGPNCEYQFPLFP